MTFGDNEELRRLAEKVQANAIATGNSGNHLAEGVLHLLVDLAARDAEIERLKHALMCITQARSLDEAEAFARDAILPLELRGLSRAKCDKDGAP